MSIDLAVLGLLGAVHDPGVVAELAAHLVDDRAGGAATARMARPENMNTTEPPMSRPTKSFGFGRR